MYNVLLGGAAGQGVETAVAMLEKALKRSGYYVFSTRDLMSRVRGGQNFSLLRFGTEPITSHSEILDGIVALNDETVDLHRDQLRPGGFILCDEKRKTGDNRAVKVKMEETAAALGNPKVSGSIAIGAFLKLFSEELDIMKQILPNFVKKQFIEINEDAVQFGYDAVRARFPRLTGAYSQWLILSGNQALGLGAIAAGLRFYSAYPMSPSTSIMEYLSSKMVDAGLVVEQAEDEIAAVNMAIGASFAGVRAMTGTSGGGFSLMVEALGLSGMAEIPLVVADIQRPGPVTGLPTRTEQSDLKFVISASQGEFPRMVIAIKNHKDAFYQTIRAFQLADKYQIPVILLSDQYLADSHVTVEPFDLGRVQGEQPEQTIEDGTEYLRYRFTADGISPRMFPGRVKGFVTADSDEHDQRGVITESAEMRVQMVDKRLRKLKGLEQELQEPEFLGEEECDTLLLGWGSTYGPIAEAIRILNQSLPGKFGALVFGDVYPLPTGELTKRAAKARRIINVEQNATGQLAGLIREATGILCTSQILKYDGRQISGEEIAGLVGKGEDK